MAVASAGSYANHFHHARDRPHHSIFTARMLFLTPNRRRRITARHKRLQNTNTKESAGCLLTLRLSPSGDDTHDVGRYAPARQADRMHVGVEFEATTELKQRHVRVLTSRVVRRMNDHLRHAQRLSCRISHLHGTHAS